MIVLQINHQNNVKTDNMNNAEHNIECYVNESGIRLQQNNNGTIIAAY